MLSSEQTIVLGKICSFADCYLVEPPDCIFRWKHDPHLLHRSETGSD